jgi:very-short-patch-repair endonuclease
MLIEPDIALFRVASLQFGVFSRADAYSCGFSRRMIQHRLATGRWIELHPDVYCLAGTPQSWERDQIAACFWAGGPSAGKAAGFLYGLPGCQPSPIEVVTPLRHRAMPRCGIVVHATKRLPHQQISSVRGIPVTSIERTLFDLCGQMTDRQAAIALDNALFRGLTTIAALDYCLYRTARRGRKGCARLRKLVKERWELDEYPNSPLETIIFELLVQAPPLPELQYELKARDGRVVRPDFMYLPEKLVIEGHSRLWHEGHAANQEDAERHDRLEALGLHVEYLTWTDVIKRPQQTLDRIEQIRAERREPRVSERGYVCPS